MSSERNCRVFLSAVTSEFEECRGIIATHLRAAGYEVTVQAEFTQPGHGTLIEYLQSQIVQCDAVVLLMGDGNGTLPNPNPLGDDKDARSWVEWEYHLALGERVNGRSAEPKPLLIYFADDSYLADHPHGQTSDQVERQKQFKEKIEQTGRLTERFHSEDRLGLLLLRDLARLLPDGRQGTIATRRSEPAARLADLEQILSRAEGLSDFERGLSDLYRMCLPWGVRPRPDAQSASSMVRHLSQLNHGIPLWEFILRVAAICRECTDDIANWTGSEFASAEPELIKLLPEIDRIRQNIARDAIGKAEFYLCVHIVEEQGPEPTYRLTSELWRFEEIELLQVCECHWTYNRIELPVTIRQVVVAGLDLVGLRGALRVELFLPNALLADPPDYDAVKHMRETPMARTSVLVVRAASVPNGYERVARWRIQDATNGPRVWHQNCRKLRSENPDTDTHAAIFREPASSSDIRRWVNDGVPCVAWPRRQPLQRCRLMRDIGRDIEAPAQFQSAPTTVFTRRRRCTDPSATAFDVNLLWDEGDRRPELQPLTNLGLYDS